MGPPAAGSQGRREWNDARNIQRVEQRQEAKKEQLLPGLKRELNRARRGATTAAARLRAARSARAAAEKKQKASAKALKHEKTRRVAAEARAVAQADRIATNKCDIANGYPLV